MSRSCIRLTNTWSIMPRCPSPISNGLLERDNWTDESELYSINTDGVFMTNPKHQYPNKKDVEFSTDQIGKVSTTNSECMYFEKHYRDNFDPDDYTDFVGDGVIYYGQAGCGKTRKLIKLASEATNPIILSFTNKAIESVK